MSGELLDIIFNFFLSLFSSDISYFEDIGDLTFGTWAMHFIDSFTGLGSSYQVRDFKYAIIGNPENYTESITINNPGFIENFTNSCGGDPYQIFEYLFAGVCTIVVFTILIILLFKLFKWIFKLIFKSFRLD